MPESRNILILNGPNLNMLGKRQPEIYGTQTLGDIERACAARAAELGLAVDFRQSNAEAELVQWLHEARDNAAGVIINAAAYTHSSIAILDALLLIDLPVIEVHLSVPAKREAFRHTSLVTSAASGVISGFGGHGYELALEAMVRFLEKK